MSQTIRRVIEPAALPLSLNEAKAHLRLDGPGEDALVAAAIRAATDLVEEHLGRALTTQTWILSLDRWPARRVVHNVAGGPISAVWEPATHVALPRAPVQSVDSVMVFADDDTGTAFSPANYFLDTAGEPARLTLRRGAGAPVPTRAAGGIEVRFIAGYGDTQSDVPVALVEGIKRLVAHLFEHRDTIEPGAASMPANAEALLGPYRMVRL